MKRRLLSMVCALAILLGMLTVPTFAATESTTGAAVCGEKNYSSLQAAVDDYTFGIIVLQEDAQNVDIPHNVHLDLNGHNVAGITVTDGVTLYVADTQTDDYTVADGIYGNITGITGDVQAADGYVAVEEGAVSYHKVDLSLKSMALRPAVAGVYYNSSFAADEVLAAKVESYGVALSVAAEPNAENLDTLCGYSAITGFASGEKSGTLLTGIMDEANTNEENAANAAMAVYGRAYIKTAEGYTFGACVSRNLQEQVEAIDDVFDALTATQKAGILAFYNTYSTAMEAWNIPNLRGEQLGETVITVPVQTENNVVTETVTVEQDGMSITIPFGTLVDAAELTLNVTKKAQSDSGIEAAVGQTLMPFDVHVEGVSAENTVPLTVALGKVMPENLNMGNYSIYHVEKSGTKEMTLVAGDEAFTAHNQYKYTLDGELTLHMATFSEIAALADNEAKWEGNRNYDWYDAEATELEIRNADQLAGFGAIVGGMDGQTQDSFAGKTVKLLADIDLADDEENNVADKIFYPIGYYYTEDNNGDGTIGDLYSTVNSFEGTFDGNGNTISNFYHNTWEIKGDYSGNYYSDAMGLFGYVVNGTVKNLTVKKFSSDGEFTPTGVIAAYAVNSTFENIALVDCNPRVYNTGNGGIVGIGGNSDDPDTYKLTFNNITIDNSNTITALWGSWDVACGGLIGMFRGDGHVYMNNCHVAAQIDVYNDVCGNYQYYWYRYSGMLIGTNKNMVTVDGKVYPETGKYHAENCTVHFGDWNNYYYCELVANSLASYTHDHQFSRLTEVDSIDVDAMTVTVGDKTSAIPTSGWAHYVVVNGEHSTENAECYHFNNGKTHDHKDYNGDGIEDKQTVNGVEMYVENNEHIFLPFNQLFTGYGWGVNHIPVYNGEDYAFDGVTILDRVYADSIVKFQSVAAEGAEYTTYTTVKIGDLFAAIDVVDDPIETANVQVTVSPADPTDPNNSVSGIYTPNATDWTQGTLTFTGVGEAKVTITDYDFCIPTTITVSVVAGDVNDTAVAMTFESVETDGKVSAFCPACAAQKGDSSLKEWYPLPVVNDTTAGRGETDKRMDVARGTHMHYYLDETKSNNGYYNIANNSQVCLNLNSNVIDSAQRAFYVDKESTQLSIMGSGTVQGKAFLVNPSNWRGSAIDAIGAVTLYGGNYISKNEAPAIAMRGGAEAVLTVFDAVTVKAESAEKALQIYAKSSANVCGGEIVGGLDMVTTSASIPSAALSGTPVIDRLTTNGHPVTVGALEDGASITVDADTIGIFTKNMASGDAAVAAMKYFHMDAPDGYEMVVRYRSLAVAKTIAQEDIYETAKAMSFADADAKTGKVTMLCPSCGYDVEWLPLGVLTKTKTYNEGIHHHFYLDSNVDYTGNESYYIFSGDAACIHLNNRTVISKQRVFISQYADGCINIMGDGTVKGSGAPVASVNMTGGALDTTAVINVYGGTYRAGNGYPVVSSRGGGTKSVINVYYATITRTEDDVAGMNVYVADSGVFNLYGGTISGGTAIQHPTLKTYCGGNILAKASGGSGYNAAVNIYGGSVTRGTAAEKGGNITLMGIANAKSTVALNISGGSVTDGSVYLTQKNATLNFSGIPIVSEVELENGALMDVSGLLLDVQPIKVIAEDQVVLTKTISENADAYAKKFFVNDARKTVVAKDNALMVDDLCPHCDTALSKITWTSITGVQHITSDGHYRLGKTLNTTSNAIRIGEKNGTGGFLVVLDLYGFNVTSTARGMHIYTPASKRNHNVTLFDSVGGSTITTTSTNEALSGSGFVAYSSTTVNVYDITINGSSGAQGQGNCIWGSGATINVYSGTFNGSDRTKSEDNFATVTNSGGVLNIYGGTFNGSKHSDGTIHCVYSDGGTMRIAGGVFDGKVSASSAASIALSGMPVMDDLVAQEGQTIDVTDLAKGAAVAVTATGVFTNELTDPADYVKHFTAKLTGMKIVVSGSALAVEEISVEEDPTEPEATEPSEPTTEPEA